MPPTVIPGSATRRRRRSSTSIPRNISIPVSSRRPTAIRTSLSSLPVRAAQQAELLNHHNPGDIAIIMGCACGGRSSEESEVKNLYTRNARAHPLTIVRTMSSAGASNISIDLKITGPTLDISTACASATHAIGLAFHMVRSGMATAALTGGHEAPLSWGFYRAWDSMRVVSPTRCRPFAADRDGMSLGEARPFWFSRLSRSATGAKRHHLRRGRRLRHVRRCQPHHSAAGGRRCAGDEEGSRRRECVAGRRGLHQRRTAPEPRPTMPPRPAAVRQVFGERAARIPISATKALHGHSIGASGALEALATTIALQEGRLPQTASVSNPDPSLGVDVIINEPRPTGPTLALS